ncbi:MAG: ABC transporter ATP-binding protein [Firmicutes bacterium]|nr:ABC transporter ATP-binding protein [Bacillota bacterium]
MKSTRLLAKFLHPYRHLVVIAPLLMLLEVMMDLMQPRMVQRIVDEGIARLDLGVVVQTGLLMVALALIGACGGISNGIAAETAVQGFGADLREALFRKIQSLSFGNLDRLGTGHLITNLTNDVAQLQEALLMLLRILVRAPLLLLGSLVMAIVTGPQLAFIPLILLPMELLAMVWVIRRTTPLYTLVQERLDGLNKVVQENLAGIRVVKSFVRAPHEEARFGRVNDDLMMRAIQAARTVAAMPSFLLLTMNLGIIGVLWFGGWFVKGGSMRLGQIIAFVDYLLTTLFSLMMVSQLVVQLARAEASAQRLQEVFLAEPEVVDRPDARPIERLQGQIAFENVTFGYGRKDEAPVLKEITFRVEPGQTVAILGSTGAGKSSLAGLIPRFYDATAGRVSVDGMDVRELSQADLRRKIGFVLQETVLFSGTIRDNIRYGRPEATDEEVIAAAKLAQAHDFIMALPDGYDTVLGQRGVNLSGGQKQRIAIARALLVNPTILILDDSTSAVDMETEARIWRALTSLRQQNTNGMAAPRTCLVIAQRIGSVMSADKILVLEDGRIVAEGTHEELLASSPLYRAIYRSQLDGGVMEHA